MPLSEAKLRELVASDEGQYHDRKSLFEGPPGGKQPRDRRTVRDQIAEQVAGFANADGGIVIFGVEDDHSITGHGYPPDVIARVLAELGVMRDQGEGIPRMFEEMEVAFLPVPTLDVISGRFCVVLRKEPIFVSADPSWPRAVRALPISLAQKRALVGLVGREFANADYCALNGVDRDTAYRELHELADRGLLVMTGSGAATRYHVVRAAAPSARPATPLESLEARMSEVGHVTNADYREAFGVDRRAATAALSAWLGEGVLVREGERRSARYRPGPRWPPR
jgi:ATP-dependent DNA helicase RecG